jgi:hypothetical protein
LQSATGSECGEWRLGEFNYEKQIPFGNDKQEKQIPFGTNKKKQGSVAAVYWGS